MKTRTIAVILAVFLGGMGAHKFYQNKIGKGFLYLLFSWTIIPSIIGVIEAIMYLTMSDEEYRLKYQEVE
ncbi:MAG: TM2 domain-containing protein [Patescibacteria group bacterium]|jgi:TM2 domain-containing membrane protein YozV|nr:TM2 domain-containing protein [Patescibacteria group bacterium]